MKKKILALILATAMVGSMFAGCGKTESEETDSAAVSEDTAEGEADSTDAGVTEAAEETTETEEKTWPDGTSVTWYIRGGAADFNNYLYADLKGIKAIEEATGIDIEFEVANAPSNEEIDEQYVLMIASGQYPDVIQYQHNNAYAGGIPQLYEDGVVLELNDLIDKYMPNYKAILEKYPDIARDLRSDDGKYLYFSRINPFETEADVLDASWFGPMMRSDWLENLGLQVPTNIDEWYQVLSAFKTQDPNGNGEQDEIPFDGGASGLAIFYPAFGITSGVCIDPATGKVVYGEATEQYKQFLETMNKWYSEGLIGNAFDENGAPIDGAVTDENIYANIAGSYKGLANYWEQRLPALLEKDPNANMVAVPWPLTSDGKQYTPSTYFSYTNREQIIITPECKYPEAVATIIDYMYSEEGGKYLTWGIEGESYTTNSDGTRQLTEAAQTNTKYYDGEFPAIFTYAMAHVGFPRFGYNDFGASSRSAEYIGACKIWSEASRDLVFPPSIVLSQTEQEAAVGSTQDLSNYLNQMQMKFITGEEPLTNFDAYVDTLDKMGINKMIEAYQAAYDRYQAR